MGIERRLAMHVIIGETARTAMASRACLDLAGALPRCAPFCVARFGHGQPRDALALVERQREAFAVGKQLPVTLLLRPRDMVRARTVTRFARHVDLGPGRMERARFCVKILAEIGRVAFGALEVPVLIQAGPVQWIARLDVLTGIQMKPALPAFRLGTRIP